MYDEVRAADSPHRALMEFLESLCGRASADEPGPRGAGEDMADACRHLSQIKVTETSKTGCEDCLKTGDEWVHLRLCLTCGHVGCCDSSKNRHATKHSRATRHPLVRSIEPGESWVWCYVDRSVVGEI